jgi:hypothetical protein
MRTRKAAHTHINIDVLRSMLPLLHLPSHELSFENTLNNLAESNRPDLGRTHTHYGTTKTRRVCKENVRFKPHNSGYGKEPRCPRAGIWRNTKFRPQLAALELPHLALAISHSLILRGWPDAMR